MPRGQDSKNGSLVTLTEKTRLSEVIEFRKHWRRSPRYVLLAG
jgi:hypothetical protein